MNVNLFVTFLGDDGTINGQRAIWWDWFRNNTLYFTCLDLVEMEDSQDIIIKNLTFIELSFLNHPPNVLQVRSSKHECFRCWSS